MCENIMVEGVREDARYRDTPAYKAGLKDSEIRYHTAGVTDRPRLEDVSQNLR